ncbi:MAG: hypothetical protein AAB421_01560 [Patescibacteria group bacterium]
MQSEHTIVIPLGYSARYSGSASDEDGGKIANGLRAVLGQFGTIEFQTRYLSTACLEIIVKRSRIPTADGGVMNLTETFSGPLGSVHRMQYGEMVRFAPEQYSPPGHLLLTFYGKK